MKPLTWKCGVVCAALTMAGMPLSGLAVIVSSTNPPETVTAPEAQPVPGPPAVVPQSPAPAAASPAPATPQFSYTVHEVLKLISAGVPEDVIKTYIQNSPYAFNLTSDNIIQLHQMGIPNGLTSEMLAHDRDVMAANSAQQPSMVVPPTPMVPQQPTVGSQPDQTVPPVDYSQYYNQLSPYGSWAYEPGYGYGWQPYSWVDTSVYPWWLLGYGSWCYFPNNGWCWFPRRGYWGGWGRNGYAFNRSLGFGRYGYNYGVNRGFNGGSHFAAGYSHFGGVNHFQAGYAHGGFSGGAHFGGGAHFSGGGGGHR